MTTGLLVDVSAVLRAAIASNNRRRSPTKVIPRSLRSSIVNWGRIARINPVVAKHGRVLLKPQIL